MSSTSQQPADVSAPAPETTAAPETAAAAAPAVAGPTPADCARELRQLFPALFDGPPKPLKLRIQADIQARTEQRFSKKLLSAVLSRHTGSTAYLVALTRATHRFDLDGQPVDSLSEEHRQIAQEELKRRRAITAERRAQERAATKPQAAPGAEGQTAGAPTNPDAPARPEGGNTEAGRGRQRRESANRNGRADGREGGARPPRGNREDRPPREGGSQARPPRGERSEARPGNGPRRAPQEGAARPQGDRPPRQDNRRPERAGAPRAETGAESLSALPENPERRQRALLLRDFERTTLTPANFCALKGMTVAALNEQLTLARQEAGEAGGARPRRG